MIKPVHDRNDLKASVDLAPGIHIVTRGRLAAWTKAVASDGLLRAPAVDGFRPGRLHRTASSRYGVT